MARNLLRQPHPHSVDLLRNQHPTSLLRPFDGNVAAHALIRVQHYFITTNANYVPAIPSLQLPHTVFLWPDMQYGTDDPTLWPQQWMFSRFLSPINDLIPRCTELRRTSPALALPLFGKLIQQILMRLEQLQTLLTTYIKMLFAVTSLQCTFLELNALYNYMVIYKERMNKYMAPAPTDTAVAQFFGAFTAVPTVAQQLWAACVPFWFLRPYEVFDAETILAVVPLLEPMLDDAHGKGALPVLYSGNSTVEKIAVIHCTALQTPWYHEPFETSFNRAHSPSPPSDAATPIASSSRPVAPHLTPHTCFTFKTDTALILSLQPFLLQAVPVPLGNQITSSSRVISHIHPKHWEKSPVKPPAPAKAPATTERDKFSPLAVEGMPPSIICMANALAHVDHSVAPTHLALNTTTDQHCKFLHHWNLLADGFIYMLMQHLQLLSTQEWRDVLEGLLTKRGIPSSRMYRQSVKLEEHIRPALEASSISSVKGFPMPIQLLPEFSPEQTWETVWQTHISEESVGRCQGLLCRPYAGWGAVGVEQVRLGFNKVERAPSLCWASTKLEESHHYVGQTATLMLNWTTKSPRPNIIRRIAEHFQWSSSDMQALESTVCRYYTQSFWEYFGHAAVVPLHLEHDAGKENGKP
ncbi:hypothetical protein B0H17DRAFT_1141726 [Mycena rosella]|uniref:Uncharacterized protein n=1 Tax=Mycena rosella TaxID=1033263 RepID=A0AAD7CZD8_MYCRO|nr:hypothetical protein B0H17DRAFT_1141726 [Mycena rosella]